MVTSEVEAAGTCPRCGNPLPPAKRAGGRAAVYCSDTCRKNAHREAKRREAGETALAADRTATAALLDRLLPRASWSWAERMGELASRDQLAEIRRAAEAAAASLDRLGTVLDAQVDASLVTTHWGPEDQADLRPAAPEPRGGAGFVAPAEAPQPETIAPQPTIPAPSAPVDVAPAEPEDTFARLWREHDPLSEPVDPDWEAERRRTFAPVTPVAAVRPATRRTATRSPRGPVRPTAEQQAIIEACRSGQHTVIEAGAGTGKTSTLRMVSDALGGRGLYLAFNKPIAQDAQKSFPSNVTARTAHSVAFNAVGRAYKERLDAPRISSAASAQILGLDPTTALECGAALLTAPVLAHAALETVKKWCQSDADEITSRHVPKVPGVDEPADRDMLLTLVVPIARAAWADIREVRGRLKFEHDHYFKIWALSRPKLPYDFICLDEAQDTNPVLARVVGDQPIQQIVVGDSNQAIYGWRGAVDALANWPASRRLRLTKSWRFGPELAEEANKWLRALNSGMRLTGNDAVRTHIGPVGIDSADAVVCRTNAETIHQAIASLAAGRRTALVGGTRAIDDMARAAQALQDGKETEHPELAMFENWEAVKEYAKTDAAGADLRVLVKLVEAHGVSGIRKITQKMVSERDAEVRISTAHKAKGREWDSVMIGGDFFEPKAGPAGGVDRDEARLSYVSITRAKRSLDRGSLEWIDEFTPDTGEDKRGRGRRRASIDYELGW